MFRLFTSTLRRSTRSIFNNTHPQRLTLRAVTYAQSKAWKTDIPQNKPTTSHHAHDQAHTSQPTASPADTNRVVIVRGLPQNWSDKDISAHFDQDSSRIQKVNLIKNRVGGNTGKALLTFNSVENAEGFISKWDRNTLQTAEFNQVITAQLFSLQKKEEPATSTSEVKADLKTVFVSNLAYNCTSDDLYNFASDFGEIVNVDAPMTANNKTKGFAFITFKETADAQKFLNFAQEKDLLGRKLRVQLSKPRSEGKAAKKSGHAYFGFSKGEGEEETSRRESVGQNVRRYKDIVSEGKTGAVELKIGKSIATKETGSGFDI